MSIFIFALLIGVVAGLRTMTAPAAVSWAAYLGWLPVAGTWAWFMGHWLTPWRSSPSRHLPNWSPTSCRSTPSRKVPQQFGAPLVTGALSGAVIGAAAAHVLAGLIAGVVGAVIGTSAATRREALVAGTGGRDLPIALVEDAVAILGALLDRELGGVVSRKFDAIIVGTGQAGPSLAGRLTDAGMTVAIIERQLFGGTCVNTGCMPTKTLVASAHAAHLARRGDDYRRDARRRNGRRRHEEGEGSQGRGVRQFAPRHREMAGRR